MTPNQFELRYNSRLQTIIGSLIIIGVIVTWFFFISGFNDIRKIIGETFVIIFGVIIGFLSITGIIISLLRFNEANEDYISYKRLDIEDKQQ